MSTIAILTAGGTGTRTHGAGRGSDVDHILDDAVPAASPAPD